MKSLVIFLFSFISAVRALDGYSIFIHTPEEVTADIPFEAKLDVEWHNGDTTYAHAFRVYLATHVDAPRNPLFYDDNCAQTHLIASICY
jgi:hypothetical protein